jgi:CBS domain containing-hemolysin-like protein
VDSVLPYVVVALLVLMNGLFVAAEFAIVGAPRTTIERFASAGSLRARAVLRILKSPRLQDRFIATAQLGITLASLGLGMYGEHTIATHIAGPLERLGIGRWLAVHAVASTLSVALLTYVHIVLGEMVPKSLALQYADRSVLWVAPPMRWVQLAVLPLVIALNGVGNGLLRLIGIRRHAPGADRYYTPEELQFIVEESEEGGVLRADAGRMLRELFEFGDLTAGQAMVPRVSVVGIPLDATTDEIRDILRDTPHTRYPVYDEDLDHVVGMVHVKDALRALMAGEPIGRGMIRPLPVIPETAPLDDVLATVKRERMQMALVIDEHGGTAGTITLADLFEEVVGEIDEGVFDVPDIRTEAGGRLRVLGTVRLGDLGDRFDLDLHHADVESVSGLVLMLLGRPPNVGDVVQFGRLRIEVAAVRGRGVEEALVALAPGAAGR